MVGMGVGAAVRGRALEVSSQSLIHSTKAPLSTAGRFLRMKRA